MITHEERRRLISNGALENLDLLLDRPPVIKLFTPDAAGTWLIAAIDPADEDRAWGLCDVGTGSPKLGWVSMAELMKKHGPLGEMVRRDDTFRPAASLGAYALEAVRVGIIVA